MLATYGQGRDPEQPLWLGSLKSNIGHTQAAAGVASVIKMVQALRHGVLPPTLHAQAPTTEVDWSVGAVELLTEAREWPRGGRVRRAGVSSFGVSGTNVHLILEEAPEESAVEESVVRESLPVGVVPLVVSARSAVSLAGQAGRLASYVESGAGGVTLAGVAGALVSGRGVFGERAVVVAGSDEEALAGLTALARGASDLNLVSGSGGSSAPGKVVWVFPGQGSQWVGMGRELLDSSLVFAERVGECAAALARWVDWDLVDVLRGEVEPEFLERVDVVQPASFAVMVGLAAVWASMGVIPDAVLGHSQGEIAAACVAGALSLEDAARVVALRSQAIAARLAGRGGMASVALSEEEVAGRLGPWSGRVEVAAVNGPSSVVVAGDAEALDEVLQVLAEDGVRVRRVAVDYASHTRHVEDIRDTLAEALAGVSAKAPVVPFYSTVTGSWVEDAGVLDARYWYRNLRGQVRFGPAVADLLAQGYGVFVEVSAHPVLVQPITEIVDDADSAAVVTGSLRRDEGGLRRLLTSMAELFVRGVAVDWSAIVPAGTGSEFAALPTYAFDHQHYWLKPGESASDAASLGQTAADHPLLGAVVRLPQSDGLVFTSRLSLRTQPWLADHAIGGVVILPGTGLVELAVRAGDETGCGVLEELVIEAPLVVPEHGGVRVQVAVGGPGETGARTVEVYSQREDDGGADTWTRHATGSLSATARSDAAGTGTGFDFAAWPPPGAQPVDIGDLYGGLVERGYGYGPAFQGVRAVWRRGDEVFAEVGLAEEQRKEAGRYGIHPALLDAALQAGTIGAAADPTGEVSGEPVLAFAWNGLVLHAAGASALRVRVVPSGPDALSVEAADETGGLVVTMDSLVSRPVSTEQLGAATDTTVTQSLFQLEWAELPSPQVLEPTPLWVPVATAEEVVALAGSADVPAVGVLEVVGGDEEDAVLALTSQVLAVLQAWLAEAALEESRLVVVTRGAVPAGGGAVTDPAGAAVWGLVRAAQSENPDRIVLLDTDPTEDGAPGAVLGAVLASGEPQIAVRGATLSVPRLGRVAGHVTDGPAVFGPEGTVLVSGAGSLGALVARHLVTRHGVRSLVLASRRGVDADGVPELVAELTGLGATVSVVACDVSDREQVKALVESVPEGHEHRLTGVVHTAGVFDDGLIAALSRERLKGVFAPKVEAVRHLDELTRDLDLDAFIVFSSVAGLSGGAGQGSYAAANAFLDGLMASRRAAGLPGLSLAWGLWEESLGMAGHLSSVDRARASRGGVQAIAAAEGMALFDAAAGSGQSLLVPVKLDLRGLRADTANGGVVPPLLRGLVRAGRHLARAADTSDEHRRLSARIAGLAAAEQEAFLLELVRTEAAVVLGHTGPGGVQTEIAFRDAGFDSLTAVELRNRLREATGLKLPATLVFDHPTPLALARHLRDALGDVSPESAPPTAVVADTGEPIAIVSMACRYPGGVSSPDELWRLVADGVDAVSDFPDDRGWDLEGLFDPDPDHAGTSYTRQGGFLRGAGLFDAGFFGISPREALAMDPQQRLLLETSWEALEHAGIDPLSLKGTDVGVFSGVSSQGYGAGAGVVTPESEGFAGTGATPSVASGRVSYVFGFEGPAVTVDTACSSSLVAIHLAAQALRHGDCSMALAGGAMVMATPGNFVAFSRQRGLATDGRCKAFADGADGMGLAEGAGVVVLERLSMARERGHRVLAVLRGSAVNQDGASNGLTAPNGPSQQRVIRRALANAGLSPSDVDAVEGHGTGTALGDPIEAQALLATYGRDRDAHQPLWLGSLKSNIGHTQAAAGVGSVIKMVQALRHGVLPPTLHVQEPTTEVDWSTGAVELLTEARAWPRAAHPRRAGVSSFGVSGTNAHLILEEVPEEPVSEEPVWVGVAPLVLSARSRAALSGQAARLAAYVEATEGVPLAGVAGALVSGRALLDDRAVVVAGSAEDALTGLRALARGESVPDVVSGSVAGSGDPGKVVWVFPGQGSQWVGMGRELLDCSPVFAERVGECAAALERWVDWSLVDVLRGEVEPELLERVDVVQPASFAVMVGLAAVWASVGVEADAVLGHSQGEIAAACVAGALSLEDAARVVALRSQAIAARLAGRGGMASVALSEEEAAGRLGPWSDRVEVAAVNGPSSVVVAGDAQALDEVLQVLSDDGVRVRRVAVDYASHTRHVEDIRDALAEALAGVNPKAPVVPFYSTVTGGWVEDAGMLDARYWYRNLRGQVRFGPAVAELLAQGHGVFVEVSAHPVLVQPVTEIVDGTDTATEVVVAGTLRREEGGLRRLLTSMAELFVRGVAVDWAAVLPAGAGAGAGAGTARVELPTYAFDHHHYWLKPDETATDAASLGQTAADHPLLGAVVRLPHADGLVFTSRLSLRSHPWLADHAVGDTVIFPGTGLVELAVRAGDETGCGTLEELVVEAPLVVPEHGGVRVQVAVGAPGETGARTLEVHSQHEGDAGADTWTRHATGLLTASQATPLPGEEQGYDFAAWPPPGARKVEVEPGGFYDGLAARGFGYGPAFQGVRAAWRRGDEVFAEVGLAEEQRKEAGRYGIHPALLDAALQVGTFAAAADPTAEDSGQPTLAFAWNGLVLHAAGAAALRVRVAPCGSDALSVQAADETGGLVVTLDSLVSRPVSAEQLGAATEATVANSLFHVDWTELPPAPVGEPAPTWKTVATAEEVVALAGSADVPVVGVLEVVGGDEVDAVLALTTRVLGVVQAWLAEADLEESRLVVVTRGAVAAGGGAVTDPAGAAVWGLVRAAQSENPDRIVLVDTDPTEDGVPGAVLGAVLASGEPQIAVRGATLSVPRLARVPDRVPDRAPVFGPEGTVLVSGGGSLGALVARHLVTRHGVRSLVLASRRGVEADGVPELVAELTGLGAAVSVVACDVSDREQVKALLGSVPEGHEHRLTGVVHTAGVFDAGVVGALTPERLKGVFAPKVEAVRHLDELTRGLDLKAFVVYSSASSVFMGAGSGGYAAANAFLDGLMAHRRAAGLPGLSLAWGPWEQTTGMADTIDDLTRTRMSRREGRGGVLALKSGEGMELFDAAVASGRPLLVPVKLDLREARADAAAGGGTPPLLRGLVRASRQPARASAGADGDRQRLSDRLTGLPAAERTKFLLDLVRTQAAVVLGHTGPGSVRADTAFNEAGFDSLTAVELRNRLRGATGLKLPATLVFDHPTPLALAAYLLDELAVGGASPADPVLAGLAGLEAAIETAAGDAEARDRITVRLRELLKAAEAAEAAEVTEVAGRRNEAPDSVDGADDDLETASDEELFAIFDRLD
ncbi:type I polyketide synthase [Streptomyces spectabilis]